MLSKAIEAGLSPIDLTAYLNDLKHLVNIDSGSRCLTGVDQVTDWLAEGYQALGWSARRFEHQPETFAKSLLLQNQPGETFDLLILCHTDTVFPAGTVAQRPFSLDADRLHGPGVADMKAGCLMALYAIRQLQEADLLKGTVGVFLNGEHELSCPTVHGDIENLAKAARLVITTEPARSDGSCVRQRKGILRFKVLFRGVSAHSGVEPEKGACANTELARFIVDLRDLEDPARGITVNPGIIRGGSSINVVSDRAELEIDMRITSLEDGPRLEKWIQHRALKPFDQRVQIEAQGGITRPPMLPTEEGDHWINVINGIAKSYGIDLTWAFSGGGSDASFASPHGIPVLCGLGPVGGGMHSSREYLERSSLLARLHLFRDFLHTYLTQCS
jgi:glutamate carboxypeptidase